MCLYMKSSSGLAANLCNIISESSLAGPILQSHGGQMPVPWLQEPPSPSAASRQPQSTTYVCPPRVLNVKLESLDLPSTTKTDACNVGCPSNFHRSTDLDSELLQRDETMCHPNISGNEATMTPGLSRRKKLLRHRHQCYSSAQGIGC